MQVNRLDQHVLYLDPLLLTSQDIYLKSKIFSIATQSLPGFGESQAQV